MVVVAVMVVVVDRYMMTCSRRMDDSTCVGNRELKTYQRLTVLLQESLLVGR